MVTAVAAVGCGASSSPRKLPRAVEKMPGEPIIRVRLHEKTSQITFNGPKRIQVSTASGAGRSHLLATPVTLSLSGRTWSGPWPEGGLNRRETLVVEAVGPAAVQVGKRAYPGVIHLVPATGASLTTEERDAFDVVNHLGIESYLPGVLEHELYANFQPATYLSQAIVARTYAISGMIDRGGSGHFDVESTIDSQVYGGQATRPIARRAAADTVGLVLTHQGKIFTAYYSSTCGGVRQSPADAFGGSSTVTPLEPKATHSWCHISPRYEWGPVQRDVAELSKRIAAWGQHRNLAIGQLGTVIDIRVVKSNHLGRPLRFRMIDHRGKAYELKADSLRHASNHHDEAQGLAPVSGDDNIRSGHFDIAIRDGKAHFTNGRGFGHGVGFCQFGAEGMARAGNDPTEILAENYPGAQIKKAY
ncbi:MAG: SpoIID/LytB domain-containing protein [Phycisphaeraceae bacterium]